MDHISKISIFLEVVKQQSFSGAGRALGITGPAVSKQVQSLENQLGVKLLRRTTRHVSLTEEGEVYSDRARKAVDDLLDAEMQIQDLRAQPQGRLKINAPMSFGQQYLAKPLALFAKKYPDLEMEVDFDDRWVDVIGEHYDVSIRIGALKDSSLVARKLADCPIKIFASPEFVKSFNPKLNIENIDDIEQCPAIIYTKQAQNIDWHYQNTMTGDKSAIKLKRKFSANNAEMQVRACIEGVGIAPLPMFIAAEHIKSGELVNILPEYSAFPERGIYALYPQNRHLSTKVRLFIDHLLEVSQGLPW